MKVLVVAAHPDDEVLGCGASIARHVDAGDQVEVLIMAEGVTSRDPVRDPAARTTELTHLRAASRQAAEILGVSRLHFGDLPDNRMDALPLLEVVKQVETVLAAYSPQQVYTHHAGDLNQDHRVVAQAVSVACRPVPGQSVRSLLWFETASSTEWQPPGGGELFAPNWFVDVSAWQERKLAALAAYQEEMRPWPHPRSMRAVADLLHWRGAQCGCMAAEAFMLARQIL